MRDEDFGQVNNLISCYSQTKLETSIGVKSRMDAISAMRLSLDPEIYANPKCWIPDCRIDQKTCLKAICASGLTPVVIENVLEGDELRTNIEGIRAAIAADPDGICCVVSTNCCFAPRAPEKVCAMLV